MLEKQKEWCQNKVEKGKKWLKKNNTKLAFGAGVSVTAAVCIAKSIYDQNRDCEVLVSQDDKDLILSMGRFNKLGNWKNEQRYRFSKADHMFENLVEAVNEVTTDSEK